MSLRTALTLPVVVAAPGSPFHQPSSRPRRARTSPAILHHGGRARRSERRQDPVRRRVPGSPSLPGGRDGTPPQPGSPAASTVKTAAIFKAVGVALSPDAFPAGGKQVADVTAVRLADGRVRLYAFAGGIYSAISTDAAGTTFVAEPGRRITWAPGGQTRAYVLGDGRVRLFYLNAGSIMSAISSDGLTFTDEGVRITTAAAGFEPARSASSRRQRLPRLLLEPREARCQSRASRPYGHFARHAELDRRPVHRRRGRLDQGRRVPSVRDLQRQDDRPLLQRRPRLLLRNAARDEHQRRHLLERARDPQPRRRPALLALTGGKTLLFYGDQIAGTGLRHPRRPDRPRPRRPA